MSGQLHAQAALSHGTEPIIELSIEYEGWWNPEPVWRLWRRGNFLAPTGNRTTSSRGPTFNQVTTATELSRLNRKESCGLEWSVFSRKPNHLAGGPPIFLSTSYSQIWRVAANIIRDRRSYVVLYLGNCVYSRPLFNLQCFVIYFISTSIIDVWVNNQLDAQLRYAIRLLL